MKRVLITGGTGFLGGYLILELLRTSDCLLVCLARGRDGNSAEERVQARLMEVADSLGLTEALGGAIEQRVLVVEGELTEPRMGLSEGIWTELVVDEIWHCAALIKFLAARRKDVFHSNVTGTQRVLELARELGTPTVNYVSTAYVAGECSGLVEEGPVDTAYAPNNVYEESKRVAEAMLADAHADSRLEFLVGILKSFALTDRIVD